MSEYSPIMCSVEEYAAQHDIPVDIVHDVNAHVQKERYAFAMKAANGLPVDMSYLISDGNVISVQENFLIKELKSFGFLKEKKVPVSDPCSVHGMTCNKMIALDLNTFALLGGKVHQHDVESAIDKYAAQTGHNIDDEIAMLNLQHRRKNVKLTLHEKYMDWLEQTANGRRIQTALIEVALWQMYGAKNEQK